MNNHLSSRRSHPEGTKNKPKADEADKEPKLVVDFDASGNVVL
tara:strand:+ start:227 stop:355 length:129 start_codon:yes stop_codon:yes gene_type:complete